MATKEIRIKSIKSLQYKDGGWQDKSMNLTYYCDGKPKIDIEIPAGAVGGEEKEFQINETVTCVNKTITFSLGGEEDVLPLPNCLTDAHVAFYVQGVQKPSSANKCMEEVFNTILPLSESYDPCCNRVEPTVMVSLLIKDNSILRTIQATEITLSEVNGFKIYPGHSLLGSLRATGGVTLGVASPLNINTTEEKTVDLQKCEVGEGTVMDSFVCAEPMRIIVDGDTNFEFIYTIQGKAWTIPAAELIVTKTNREMSVAVKPECFATQQLFYPYAKCNFQSKGENITTNNNLFAVEESISDTQLLADVVETIFENTTLLFVAIAVGICLGCMCCLTCLKILLPCCQCGEGSSDSSSGSNSGAKNWQA